MNTLYPLPATATEPAPGDPAAAERVAATVATVLGKPLSAGVLELSHDAGGSWSGVMTRLDRPGIIASMYYGGGLREVLVHLDDGRVARACIAETSFAASRERICMLTGLTPLRRAAA